MSRKRRVFDITLPEDDIVAPEPSEPPQRRGPMASAISENAEALQARKSAAKTIREENDALAHEYVARREAGGVVDYIALDDVHTFMLVRDRIPGEDPELENLMMSIQELGLSNPIRVIKRPDGAGVELVQGYRRLSAYKTLFAETGSEIWSKIPALILVGAPDVASLYRQMVDENVIRKDLSFAEMAHAAQVYANDPQTDADNLSDAVAALFQSAPYSKRSYIRSFAFLLDQLGENLAYPTEIPRALGITLARSLKEQPKLKAQIITELGIQSTRGIQDELAILRRFSNILDTEPAPNDKTQHAKSKPKKTGSETSKPKTTFDVRTNAGQAKCFAAAGRLEIKVDRDFSTIDRAQLEKAIAELIERLD